MTPAEAHAYVTNVRTKFPTPVRYPSIAAEEYCVAIAVMLFIQQRESSAEGIDVCGFLSLNPDAPDDIARDSIHAIVSLNDRGQFNAAWRELERYLAYPYLELSDASASAVALADTISHPNAEAA